MLNFLTDYWWIALPTAAVAAFYVLRFVAARKLESFAEDILHETQAGVSNGDVQIRSVTNVGTKVIEDETATLYNIDATITPSDGQVEWAAADLFLYGIDEDGDENRMRMGEVTQVQRWNGSEFEPIKRGAKQEGSQRLRLSILFAGTAGPARFNYNFACFGPVFELPASQPLVLVAY